MRSMLAMHSELFSWMSCARRYLHFCLTPHCSAPKKQNSFQCSIFSMSCLIPLSQIPFIRKSLSPQAHHSSLFSRFTRVNFSAIFATISAANNKFCPVLLPFLTRTRIALKLGPKNHCKNGPCDEGSCKAIVLQKLLLLLSDSVAILTPSSPLRLLLRFDSWTKHYMWVEFLMIFLEFLLPPQN